MKLFEYIYYWLQLGVLYRNKLERIRRRYECDYCKSDCGQCGNGSGMMVKPKADALASLKEGRGELWEIYWGKYNSPTWRQLEKLRKGDVILVPSGRRSGLAVVVDPGLDPLREPRPVVVTEDRWSGPLSAADFTSPGVRKLAYWAAVLRFSRTNSIGARSGMRAGS